MGRNVWLFFFLAFFCTQLAFGQSQEGRLQENKNYQGAEATKEHYKVIYQLDSKNPEIIEKAFRNIRNLLTDPRLKERLEVHLVTFSGGTEALLKNSAYRDQVVDLIEKNVQVTQCLNSLKERNLKKEDLFDFVGYTPSGNGELVIRAAEGWTIVKP
ncbi:DsrE family protein [Sphingobacterium sp. UT-1RO-CII-1]|uniref:DsrE family protein n=1 Tax=Sphingobacterium sp. UT-1RO-CII-1 TaxID=2995225 RepID=UPI00227BF3DC|nr:DsrE family protein [Sphingobacterium sp. UT-1RO-CII-1]MCY4780447.1 DsrE family protein [Sphingobacterium sp. UT-1RO-CII-1]